MAELFDLTDLQRFSPGASAFIEGGLRYIFLPGLRLPPNCTPQVCDALLCMDPRDGYPTRLFFAECIQCPKGTPGWTVTPVVGGRAWKAYSWNHVQPAEPIAVLNGHLLAFAS